MTDIDSLLEIVADPCTLDIHNHWKSLPLHEIHQYKNELVNSPGIYAIADRQCHILYLGKARSIYHRLYSHHNATQKKEKAEAWAQFFDYFNSDLRAYYFIVDGISDSNIERANQAIERILQIKHSPLFDQIYNLKGKKRIEDFEGRLIECDYTFPTDLMDVKSI